MNQILKNKLKEFFRTHPTTTEVFVALGVLFITLEKANRYLGGTKDQKVQHVTRTEVEAWNVVENNSGNGGTTDQQPNGDQSAEGSEAGAADSPSENTETDQNTDAGNVTENGDPGDEQNHVDNQIKAPTNEENIKAFEEMIEKLENEKAELVAAKAHHKKIKAIQKQIDENKAAMAKLSS